MITILLRWADPLTLSPAPHRSHGTFSYFAISSLGNRDGRRRAQMYLYKPNMRMSLQRLLPSAFPLEILVRRRRRSSRFVVNLTFDSVLNWLQAATSSAHLAVESPSKAPPKRRRTGPTASVPVESANGRELRSRNRTADSPSYRSPSTLAATPSVSSISTAKTAKIARVKVSKGFFSRIAEKTLIMTTYRWKKLSLTSVFSR
jgi:hypothetical protein